MIENKEELFYKKRLSVLFYIMCGECVVSLFQRYEVL